MNRRIEVMDIETILGLFTYTGYNIDTGVVSTFIIHKEYSDQIKLIEHIKSLRGMVGFNSLNFDHPILHWIYHSNKLLSSKEIHGYSQKIINSDNYLEYYIKPQDYICPQLDLFKVWHFNNKARRTSLKALEIAMNYPNVQDMPIDHNTAILSNDQIKEVLEYNLNDVMATKAFYNLSLDKIELRKDIRRKYGLNCSNFNNGKIGEELLLKLYCEKTRLNPWEVKKLRTNRSKIELKECTPNIEFNSKEFSKLLKDFNNTTISNTKGSVDFSLIYKNLKYFYGTGGVHAAIKAGIYESNDKYIIKSCDVSSLYPSLPIAYRFYPEHLGEAFLEVYNDEIVKVRLTEKAKGKDGDKTIIAGFKEAANIPYGKSNDEHSFLYDPLYSMKTTIYGQLLISKLCEILADIPDSQILMVNTDGLEILIPREYEYLYKELCSHWENNYKLQLEFIDYQKMWIRDINNYGCISINGKIKCKGAFKTNEQLIADDEYHKDTSFGVIRIALLEYFTKRIPIEVTIKNHRSIYDFCGRQKFTSDSYGVIYQRDNNDIKQYKQQKNVRYYISTNGNRFVKHYLKGTTEIINKGYVVTIFNNYINQEWQKYAINYNFYIKEAQKEIDNIIDRQLDLFM